MTDQIITWLNGLSALILISSAWIMAIITLFFYFRDKNKKHINLFFFLIAVALGWTGITISFLSVAIFGFNLPWVRGIISYFSYSTIPIGATMLVLIVWDVVGSPKNKKVIVIIFLICSIIYYIVLYTTFQQAIVCPEVPKGEIYDDWIAPNSFIFVLIWIIVSFVCIMFLFGFNKFRKMTAGDLKNRAKFIMLSVSIIGICILLDTVVLGSIIQPHVNYLFIVRFLMIFGSFAMYWGFRISKTD